MSDFEASVVIPAFNEEKSIEDTLFSLLRSEQNTKIKYEVILVDNNSTDKTIQIAEKFSNGMDLRIIKETKQGRGAARARGFNEAKGEFILSADADTIFFNNWIELMVSELKNKNVGVTTSCKIIDGPFLTRLLFNTSQPLLMILYRIIFGHFWLSGFSFGIKKSIYLQSGGFDAMLQAQEDTDLSFRVSKFGKIKFINLPVIVSDRRFKKGLFIGYFEYISSYFHAIFKDKKNAYLDNPR